MNKVFRDKLKQKYPRGFKALVFFVCFVALLGIICLIFSITNNKQLGASKYPYIDFSRNFQNQKDYITNLQPLRNQMRDIADKYSFGDISIYIEFLNTGANISVNQDTYVFPASLLKLPIAITAMKKVEKGDWELDSELVLMEQDKNLKSGNPNDLLANRATGSRIPVRDLMLYSLRDSDNTAFNILYRNLSDVEIQEFVDSIGLDKLSDKEGKLSAKEYSRIFRSLYTASFLNIENSQKILQWLDQSTFNEFLSASVDEKIPFPHKYGENLEQKVFLDSGIVYLPNRPYIISVMIDSSKAENETLAISQSSEIMKEISSLTYNYFSSYKK